MVVDTSALIAVLLGEPETASFSETFDRLSAYHAHQFPPLLIPTSLRGAGPYGLSGPEAANLRSAIAEGGREGEENRQIQNEVYATPCRDIESLAISCY